MTILGSTYAEFLITLAKPVKEVVRVAWSTVDFTARAGIDYEATSGVAVFAPGETEKSALVLVYPAKGTEQRAFRLKIETPINAVLGTLTVAEATIIPRDDLTDVHISVAEGPKGDTVGYQYSGNTPPPAPYAGDKWQSPADGTVYTWTVTASGGQWVEYFPGAVAQGEAPPAWDTVNAWASGDESTVISIDGKPLPSPAKVIADSEASLTALADTADEWLTGDENTTVNLGGRHVRTPAKMIADAQNVVEASLAILGYNPPVPYAPNIRLTLPNQTVEYRDQVYAPIASWLPFTTGNTFDPKKFRLISGINGADLSSPNGVLMVGNAMDKREYDKINNTPDMQKPLSIPQAAALRDLADGLVVRIEEEAGGIKEGLSGSDGGAKVGFDGITAQDVMDEARPMQSYAQLRAYSGRAKGVRITSHGIAGLFQRDDEDTVAEDDGGATIVDASGRRWKRLIDSDVNITWFGAKKGQDSSAAIRAAINYVKTNGGVALAPAGEWLCKNIRLDGGTRGWALRGAGKKETVFKHIDGAGTLLSGSPGSAVPYTLQGFTIDCQHSVYNHPDANHGVSIPDSSGVRVIDVHVRDFKNCPILFFATVPNVYGDNQMIDCSADGLGVASNGFLFVDMDNCGYSRCYIKGLSKVEGIRSPGYGIQFKNNCRWGFLSDCAADDCYIGLGFGNDNGQIGVQFCTIANMRSSGCVNAMLASHSYGNSVNNLVIDMAAANPSDPVEDAINLLANCVGNTFSNIAARNISAVRSAIRIRSGSTDNNIHFGIIEGINTTGKVAAFDAGAKYNHVRLSRMTNPRVRQNNLSSMVSFADPSDNNSWEYDGYPMMEAMTIADGSVVVANPKTTAFIVDTEGGAATDELTTITTGFALEGRTLTLRTANDARDVTVRNDAGNIVLAGSNCVLGNRRSSLTLMYQAANNKWIEVSRSLNT